MLNIQLARQILTLALRGRADAAADLAVTDAGAQAATGILFNQMQHQIGGGGTAGAADQVAIDLIQ